MELNSLKGVSAWLVYNKIVFSFVFLRQFNRVHNDQLVFIELFKTAETLEDYKDIAEKVSSEKFKKVNYTQAEIVTQFKLSTDNDKRNMLLEALTVTDLSDDDCIRLLSVHTDANGVPFSRSNIKNVPSSDIIPKMLETLLACAELECDFSLMSEADFKTLKGRRVGINDEVAQILASNAEIKTSELLSLAVKNVIARFRNGNPDG